MICQLFIFSLLPIVFAVSSLPWFENYEENLMSCIEHEECEKEQSVMKIEAATELSRFICLLNDTDEVVPYGFSSRRIVSLKDEKRSDLYVALRNSATYFNIALCANRKLKKVLWSEKLITSSEFERSTRHLVNGENLNISAEEKGKLRMVEDSFKIREANERAQALRAETKINWNDLTHDCVKTVLPANCRWLGNYKKRIQMAEKFENLTKTALNEQSNKQTIELPYEKEAIEKCIQEKTKKLTEVDEKLNQIQPRTGLLKAIDSSISTLLHRDDAMMYSKSLTIDNLKELLNLTQSYYSRFVVPREDVLPIDWDKMAQGHMKPSQMIATLTEEEIDNLGEKFGKVMDELDFASILDYDD